LQNSKWKEEKITWQPSFEFAVGYRGFPDDMEPFVLPPEPNPEYHVKLVSPNQLQLPEELSKKLGLEEGLSSLKVVQKGNRLEICPNLHSLAKLYIEPTSKCNLHCETCIRHTWHEPLGSMDRQVFDSLIEQMKEMKSLETVMFGGFGEPTFHKDILYMVGRVKSLGLNVEITTNGTLLNRAMAKGLLENKLDTLWVSFDGCSADVFEDIREGAKFNNVVENLRELQRLNRYSPHKIKIGIAFVVMKRNINDLKNLGKLATRIGAQKVSVSNVIPYSAEMVDEMVCDLEVCGFQLPSCHSSQLAISIPLIDKTELTKQPLFDLFKDYSNISIMRNKVGTDTRSCRFIQERCAFVRWDGVVSPCMGLLHSHRTYFSLGKLERDVTHYGLGSIKEQTLKEIWDSPEYHNFREKVNEFSFSPCLLCASCDLARKNEEDCFGNTFPTCGGCLWSQGVIQCP